MTNPTVSEKFEILQEERLKYLRMFLLELVVLYFQMFLLVILLQLELYQLSIKQLYVYLYMNRGKGIQN